MRRRDFIRLVGLSPALPLAARAQQGATSGRAAKIGVHWHAGSAEEEKVYLDSLTKAFDDLGYVEGKNVVFLRSCIDFPPNSWSSFAASPKSWSKAATLKRFPVSLHLACCRLHGARGPSRLRPRATPSVSAASFIAGTASRSRRTRCPSHAIMVSGRKRSRVDAEIWSPATHRFDAGLRVGKPLLSHRDKGYALKSFGYVLGNLKTKVLALGRILVGVVQDNNNAFATLFPAVHKPRRAVYVIFFPLTDKVGYLYVVCCRGGIESRKSLFFASSKRSWNSCSSSVSRSASIKESVSKLLMIPCKQNHR